MAKFSVRARAVDMLGRQQIAGIPTALHELFKNAHDAYARRVEVDYFRAQRQLILRDDGDGMSHADFVGKWLTLGTESKINANDKAAPSQGRRGLKPRKILGEKGIGRLAIAAIGDVVLVMTRQDPQTSERDTLTIALVHWGLFELPGVDLSDIDLPVTEIQGGHLPDAATIMEMGDRVRTTIDRLVGPGPSPLRISLVAPLERMLQARPQAISDWLAAAAARDQRPNLSLEGSGHGTHFLIAPVDPIIDADIDGRGTWGSSPFQRLLLGFGNTLAGDGAEFSAEFRDHQTDGRVPELIGGQSFFTPEEFRSVDHHFEGRFDEFGQFTGTIQLYRGDPKPYVLSWPQAAGKMTECGPFNFRLGYLMGLADESRLSRDEHGPMYDKLNRLGGLYIYRDGIRVLPYGNSDYDFVNIEQRRTLAAKDWFFSYRRMIGWIDITHEQNASLVEKAGREGFRENKAYRQFRDILEHFFRQMAIDYFRNSSDLGEEFRQERERLQADAARLKRRDASSKERKSKFSVALHKALAALEAGTPAILASQLTGELDARLEALELVDSNSASDSLLKLEAEFLDRLSDIESDAALARPRGFALVKSLEASWTAYDRAFTNLRRTLFEPARVEIVARIEAFRVEHHLAVERQRRAAEAIGREKTASLGEVRRLRREAEQAIQLVDSAVREAMREEVAGFQNYVEDLMADLGRMNLDDLKDSDAYESQRGIERALDDRLREGRNLLSGVRDQLIAVAHAVSQGDDVEETAAALERRNVELQDRLDLYTDLAQAGSAIGIVGHEFGNVADGFRRSIDRLKPWADGTPQLKVIHNDIVSYFSELDGYLNLFAPLSRRRYRRKTRVAGAYIEKYLIEALSARLDQAGVALKVTDAFRLREVECLLPTALGAALNIVDNAIYWSKTNDVVSPSINLDADKDGWLFTNTGPGVPFRLEERIFEFGISTKSGGRGMGLAISRDALRKVGCDLTLVNPGEQNHPIFKIGPSIEDEGEAE